MNIIVFSKRWGHARQYELARPAVILACSAIVLATVSIAFYAGLRFAAGGPARSQWSYQLQQQGSEIDSAKRQLQEKLNALAARVGQMNAHVIRLDALGKRITEMAGLDKGEFNFGQEPAQGGPESDVEGPAVVAPDLNIMLDRLLEQLQDRERQLSVLENLIATRNLNLKIVPSGRPVVSGYISSYFGSRSDPFTGRTAFHKGLDFAGNEGSQVVAVAAGVVTWAGDRSGYGRLVELNHGNGYITRYGHNEKLLVAVGDKVERGRAVSLIGSTGRSTGPHLHFEVLKNGSAIDPLRFVGRNIKDQNPAQIGQPLFDEES